MHRNATPYPAEDRHCPICGALLVRRENECRARFNERTTCGGSCRAKLSWKTINPQRIELVCAHCEKTFTIHPSNLVNSVNGSRRRYCSAACRSKHDRGVKRVPFEESAQEKINCRTCQKEFIVWKAQNRKYCSPLCGALARVQKRERDNPSTIEVATEQALQSMGVPYRSQEIVRPYVVDFYLHESNCILELLGDYFHSNPEIFPESKRSQNQRYYAKRDQDRFNDLRQRGYRLVTMWESDIRRAIKNDSLAEMLRKAIA
jgi:DNA G:T-mismatch repair endonuclease